MAALIELWQQRRVLCVFCSWNRRFCNDVGEYFDVLFNYSEIALEPLYFLARHENVQSKSDELKENELTLIGLRGFEPGMVQAERCQRTLVDGNKDGRKQVLKFHEIKEENRFFLTERLGEKLALSNIWEELLAEAI